MKKQILIITTTLILLIGSYIVLRNLPLIISRSSDIKLGNDIIKNIENYQKTNGLPDNTDWETLRNFGFRENLDFFEPVYNRINKDTFELIFAEGFDGPYLLWNSKERIWKKGFQTSPQNIGN